MKIIIYGNSDFAKLMYYYFSTDSHYEVLAFCVDRAYLKENNLFDIPVVPFETLEELYPPSSYKMFVAVGYRSMRVRKILFEKTKAKGYEHINYISSTVKIDKSHSIGTNNAFLSSVVLEPFVTIGNNNIINTGTIICHHALIDNHCFIGAKSLIGGFTQIKECCFIGFSSTILQKLFIEKETLIGAGSLMNRNSLAYTKYLGIPARMKNTHHKDGIKIED